MKYLFSAVALMLCSFVASAVDMPELAKKRNCTECHDMERKAAGPAWMEVAKRYKGNNEASIFLANKIRMGGFGIWGLLPMPAQRVSIDEADVLTRFILGLSTEPRIAVSKR
jgi:cytochrome c